MSTRSELGDGRLWREELGEGIVRLVVNNPERRNALDVPLVDLLMEDLLRLRESEALRVLILSGAGEKAFCSGFNIGALGRMEARAPKSEEEGPDGPVMALLRVLEGFPVPTIAQVNGHTFGVGVELAITCDFRVSGGVGKMGVPPAKLGICYPAAGIRKVVAIAGPNVAKELFFTAEPVSMAKAYEAGLITHLVAPEQLEEATLALARKIAAGAPLAVRGMKRTFYLLATEPGLSDQSRAELLGLQARCFASKDFAEGAAAFLQKREPKFTGK